MTALPARRRWWWLAVLLAVAIAGWLLTRDHLGMAALRDNREALLAWRNAGPLRAALVYAVVTASLVALSLPGGFVLTVAAGFLFGFLPGTLLATVAQTAGATLAFLAARYGAGPPPAHDGTGRMAAFERGLARNPVSALLLLRLVPVVPFVLANVLPAFFGVRLRLFVATTLAGILPGTAITAWIGVGAGAVLEQGGTPGAGLLADPRVLGPTLALCALAGLPMALRALRRT